MPSIPDLQTFPLSIGVKLAGFLVFTLTWHTPCSTFEVMQHFLGWSDRQFLDREHHGPLALRSAWEELLLHVFESTGTAHDLEEFGDLDHFLLWRADARSRAPSNRCYGGFQVLPCFPRVGETPGVSFFELSAHPPPHDTIALY